jgi:hypothetical protein
VHISHGSISFHGTDPGAFSLEFLAFVAMQYSRFASQQKPANRM